MLSQICVSGITVLHMKSEGIYSQDCEEDIPDNHPHENLLQFLIKVTLLLLSFLGRKI